jgi:hypothetical protein
MDVATFAVVDVLETIAKPAYSQERVPVTQTRCLSAWIELASSCTSERPIGSVFDTRLTHTSDSGSPEPRRTEPPDRFRDGCGLFAVDSSPE